jgi:hypothetical protein
MMLAATPRRITINVIVALENGIFTEPANQTRYDINNNPAILESG